MAVVTSAQTGLKSSTSTWVGGVIPGDGDTIIIADTHTVTIDEDTTVGTSPAPADDAITCQGSGSLVVSSGNTLTVKGNITTDESEIRFNSSHLVINVGSGLLYQVVSATYGEQDANIVFNGTAENRCSVSKTGDGAARINIYMSGNNGNDIASFTASYTDFSNLGDGSNYSIYTRRGSLSFNECVFDACYPFGNGTGSYFYPNLDVVLTNCTFKNAAGSWDCDLSNLNTDAVTGQRTITGCVFDAGPRFIRNWGDLTWQNNYLTNWSHTNQLDSTEYIQEWNSCFINRDADFPAKSPSVKNCFRYVPSQDNAHFFILTDESLASLSYEGNILEHGTDWSSNEPDGVLNATNISSSTSISIKHNLVLPNANNRASCALFTDNCAGANVTWTVDKNTFFSDDRGGGQVAAHGTGSAGRIASFRSNLGYCEESPTDATLLYETGDAVPADDYITVADYNAWNYINTAYDVTAGGFASTPGSNDVTSVDPKFVDDSRDLATWSQNVLGNTGTDAELKTAALNALKAKNEPNDSNYNANASIENLVTWVKEGFAPRNKSLQEAGHDGSYIGAFDIAVSTGSLLFACIV